MHAQSEEKGDNSKGSFYKEIEQISDHFLENHMKILLGCFNEKFGKEGNFKPTIRKESTSG